MLKKFMIFALMLFTTCCATSSSLKSSVSRPDVVTYQKGQTVAFTYDMEGKVSTYCAGVWVSHNEILTMAHCARTPRFYEELKKYAPQDRMFVILFHLINEDELDPMDVEMNFSTEVELPEVGMKPLKTHAGRVVAVDKKYDLALVKVPDQDVPTHFTANLASNYPRTGNAVVGSKVTIVGHPNKLLWTWFPGTVAALRKSMPDIDHKGPFLQITAPVFYGNSGGPVFDEDGDLIGVFSFITRAPNEGFAIHADSIREFLVEAHKIKAPVIKFGPSKQSEEY